MYKALYTFTATDNNALDFRENDTFTVLDKSRDNYWWFVQNGKGQVGFVPANYLKNDEASFSDVLKSIDRTIEAIIQSAPLGNLQNLTALQEANLQKLHTHRKNVVAEYKEQAKLSQVDLRPKRQAPTPPTSPISPRWTEGNNPDDRHTNNEPQKPTQKRQAPTPPSPPISPRQMQEMAEKGGQVSRSKRSSAPPPPPVRTSVLSSASSQFSPSPQSPRIDQASPGGQQGSPVTMEHRSNAKHSPHSQSGYQTATTPLQQQYDIANRHASVPKYSPTSSTPVGTGVVTTKEFQNINSPPEDNLQANYENPLDFKLRASLAHSHKSKAATLSPTSAIFNQSRVQPIGSSYVTRAGTKELLVEVNLMSPSSSSSLCDQCKSPLFGATNANHIGEDVPLPPPPSPPTAHESILIDLTDIKQDLAKTLVTDMRNATDLSYGQSQEAVQFVLRCLSREVPKLTPVMDVILQNIDKMDSDTTSVDFSSKDAVRLNAIFTELARCKEDSQQRSWFLHEDEHIIRGYLEELISILNGAQADVSKAVVKQDHYAAINNLVAYYQMEQRSSLRMLLLQVFGSLCALDAAFISELLTSPLPLELARDVQADTADLQKLCYSLLVLTMLFSMGEKVPLHFYTHLNDQFLHFLVGLCEKPHEDDSYEQILDLVVNLILAYNLHFELPEENDVMRVLAERQTAKFFTERLMLLVNRGVDPVRMFEHEPRPASSLLKFLSDLYSSRATSCLLYTNDARVLIDIIVGQLADIEPNSTVRTDYLSLMELIIRNTDYAEHCHRRDDLQICFRRIEHEEESESDLTQSNMDKTIVRQIWQEFPEIFPSQSSDVICNNV